MTSSQATIHVDTNYRKTLILKIPSFLRGDMSKKLGIIIGRLNQCLNALFNKSSLKVAHFTKSKLEFKYVHLITSNGFVDKEARTSRFMKGTMNENYELKPLACEDKAESLRKKAQ